MHSDTLYVKKQKNKSEKKKTGAKWKPLSKRSARSEWESDRKRRPFLSFHLCPIIIIKMKNKKRIA